MRIRLVISGRNYDLADAMPEELSLPEGSTLDEALAAVAALLSEGAKLPASCLVAVGGEHLGTVGAHPSRPLRDGDELMLVAPIAGG